MAKARPRTNPSVAHHPTIPPELALKRLQKLLEHIPEVRSSGHDSAVFPTWEKNVKIVLAESYGEDSLIFKEFQKIWFTPGVYYDGQPNSEFVKALNSGLDLATGFLESRVNDLLERVQPENPGSEALSYTSV